MSSDATEAGITTTGTVAGLSHLTTNTGLAQVRRVEYVQRCHRGRDHQHGEGVRFELFDHKYWAGPCEACGL